MQIVLLDRDRRFCDVAQSVLAPEGHEVLVAGSAERAIQLLRKGRVDLLVCDVGIDGAARLGDLESLQLTEADAQMDIILTSSVHHRNDPRIVAALGDYGARGFFRKPFSLLDFGDAIRKLHHERASRGGDSVHRRESVAPTGGRPVSETRPAPPAPPRPEPQVSAARSGVSRSSYRAVEAQNVTIEDPSSLTSVSLVNSRRALREEERRARGTRSTAARSRVTDAEPGVGVPGWRRPSERRADRNAARQAKTPTARPVNRRVAHQLGQLWSERSTGYVTVVLDVDRPGRKARLVGGGPAGVEDQRLLAEALYGESITFESSDIPGTGDWASFGALLYSCVRDPRQADFVELHGGEALVVDPSARTIQTLPLSGAVRRILASADGATTVAELVRTDPVNRPETIAQELEALRVLGLVRLEDIDEDVSDLPTDQVEALASAASSAMADSVLRDLSVPSDLIRPQLARRRGRQGIRDAMREARTKEMHLVARRLERELSFVRSAKPQAVLSLPANPSLRTIARATERMRSRYRRLALNVSVTDEVRALAEAILERVEAAAEALDMHKEDSILDVFPPLQRPEADASSLPGQGEALALLEQGRHLLARQAWAEADAVLGRAKDLRLDHAGILANLAWARLHNDRFEEDERIDEAKALLLLAEQFDAASFDCQYYLALLLERLGETESAYHRARRAFRLDPESAPARALAHRIKAALEDAPK